MIADSKISDYNCHSKCSQSCSAVQKRSIGMVIKNVLYNCGPLLRYIVRYIVLILDI